MLCTIRMLQQFFNNAIVSVNPIPKNREEADRIMRKYPDRIPVVVTKNKNSTTTPDIDKHKYLVPVDLTIGQLQFVIRKRLHLSPEKGLFLFIDSMAVCHSELVVTAYERDHDREDGFLHVVYSCENVFGSENQRFSEPLLIRENL